MSDAPQRGGTCPRCGAPYDPTQEYCLECGARLPAPGPAAAAVAVQRRVAWTRRPWVPPVVVGLAIAAVMTGLAILIARGTENAGESVVIATSPVLTGPTTVGETSATTATTATAATAPTTTTRPRPPRRTLVEWPPSQSGYTVVIASLPASGGRVAAIRKAREALGSGLREVGVLESSEFSSLHPGYYVVFSGIYDNQRDAVRAAPRVQDLYPVAYIRQISR